jgi:hypothetical protein
MLHYFIYSIIMIDGSTTSDSDDNLLYEAF